MLSNGILSNPRKFIKAVTDLKDKAENRLN